MFQSKKTFLVLSYHRECVRNLKTGVQVFGPVKQKPVVGGDRKGHENICSVRDATSEIIVSF